MKSFLKKYQDSIIGAINGFDRLLFRGTIRRIASVCGIVSYMQYHKILCKDFADWSTEITNRIRSASEQVAHDCQRPVHYINSSSIDKEEYARTIAKKDNIKKGLLTKKGKTITAAFLIVNNLKVNSLCQIAA